MLCCCIQPRSLRGWIPLGCCWNAEELVLHWSVSASAPRNQRGWAGAQLLGIRPGGSCVFCSQKEGEQWQGKPSSLCQCISCPSWRCCVWVQLAVEKQQCRRSGIASWLLSPCPGGCSHGPATCCQSSWACTDPSVGTEQPFSAWFAIKEHFSLSAGGQLPAAALCPCGRALQAALAAGSRTLKTDIALLGVQVLFLFAFFFSQGLFRVWMCYCQSLKAGRPKKGWPLIGSR